MAGKTIGLIARSRSHRPGHRLDSHNGLIEAGIALFGEPDSEAVHQRLVDSVRPLVKARYSALTLRNDGRGPPRLVTSGTPPEWSAIARRPTPPNGTRATARAARSATAGLRGKAFLDLPIAGHDHGFANLYLAGKVGGVGFDAADERMAHGLVRMAAVALNQVRAIRLSHQLLEQARTIQCEHDFFFAAMNHELRNALTGVFGWAERLVRLKPANPAVQQAARETFECAESSIKLLNNLMDLSRLDAGKVRPVWREVSLRGTLQRIFLHQRPTADVKRLMLEERCEDGLPDLRTDPVRLTQILTNLLSNAIRHSPDGATITVEINRTTDGVSFRVIDRGPGVSPEALDRIFQPFERGDPLAGVGAGLGLPVSRRLAEVLGGRLTVATGVARGATFELVLPQGPATDPS